MSYIKKYDYLIYMGIERFYFAIRDKLKDNLKNMDLHDCLERTTLLYIDFNSIIHNISSKIVFDFNVEFLLKLYDKKEKKYDVNLCEQAKKWRDTIDEIILNRKIIDAIIDNVNEKIETVKNAKAVYIAFDGIPEISKCAEQKHRRYTAFIFDKVEQNIEEHYQDSISVQKFYNDNKFIFDKRDISAYSEFMIKLLTEIKKKYMSNVKVNISGADEYGEGEKKIMKELLSRENIEDNDNILILSPDADMILLASIALCQIRRKYNTNPNIYVNNKEIVDIKKLENYVNTEIERINKKMQNVDIRKESGTLIFKDFIFMCTFFGNDFLPKIMSFSEVYDNIDVLLTVYSQTLSSNEDDMLLRCDRDDNCQINFERLKLLIGALIHINEKSFDVYIDTVQNGIFHGRQIKNMQQDLQKYGYEETMYRMYIDIKKRNSQNINIENHEGGKYICENPYHYVLLSQTSSLKENQFELFEIIERNKRQVPAEIIKYINDNFNRQDYEFIAFRTKKSVWKILLNDNNYDYKMNVVDNNIVEEYVNGLMWVTDWYFNRIGKSGDISVWFYKHHKTPFLFQLYEYLEKTKQHKLNDILVKKEYYFKKHEYKKYIELRKFEKDKIEEYISSTMKMLYTIKIDYLKDTFYEISKKLRDYKWDRKIFIDCKHARFINKCILRFKLEDYNTYIHKIRSSSKSQKGGSCMYFRIYQKYLYKNTYKN